MPEYFDEELLRTLLMRVLRNHSGLNQFGTIVKEVVALARKEELFPCGTNTYYENRNLKPEDEFTLQRLTWELIVQLILVPGSNSTNPNWPHLSVTPYGKKVLEKEGPTPYETNEYLRQALEAANEINPVIRLYLRESIQAFRRGLFLSSAVMLGVASEAALEGLSEVVCRKAPSKKSKIHNAYNVKAKHQIIMDWILETGVLETNSELKNNVESYLGELFQANRLTRNESGHPTGKEIQRDNAYGFLYLFPSYLKTIKELMEFLESQIADPT